MSGNAHNAVAWEVDFNALSVDRSPPAATRGKRQSGGSAVPTLPSPSPPHAPGRPTAVPAAATAGKSAAGGGPSRTGGRFPGRDGDTRRGEVGAGPSSSSSLLLLPMPSSSSSSSSAAAGRSVPLHRASASTSRRGPSSTRRGVPSTTTTPAAKAPVGRPPATAALSLVSSGSATSGQRQGTVSRLQDRPTATVQSLHEREVGPGVTAKGRAIQQDMHDLADDYFGSTESRAPAAASGSSGGGGGLRRGVSASAFSSSLSKVKTFYTEAAVPRRWFTGPRDTEGREFDASGSNLLCMDVLASCGGGNPLCVVGSADHGLKVFDLTTMREKKNLFNKTNGHAEWVTCCRFLPDGRVLSGGMDNKLCLWASVLSGGSIARCQDLLGHTASISQIEVNGDGHRAISASYDRTLRVWDCSTSVGREVGLLAGHKAPVMQFDWCGVQVLSGDRQGQAKVWDVERATCLCTAATQRGQIGAVQQFYHDAAGELTMLGDQGGVLTVLDLRQGKRPICQREVHPGGVLSGIRGVQPSSTAADGSGPYVATCGADKRICVLDPRADFAPVHTLTDHTDFIYSMETFGPLVVSGAGNGWVLVHNTETGECCYGLGAGKNAIREVFTSPKLLVAAGDDGKAVVYDF